MHKCEVLVISCIDFRFQEALKNFLNSEFKHNYDLVCLAGSAKNFVSDFPFEREVLLKQIKISSDLHQIKKVYLINHQNCGAYGPSLVSGSVEERQKHSEDLQLAKEQISALFSNLEVFKIFAHFDEHPTIDANFTIIK